MAPVFIPGGRIFFEGPTHGFSGWPGGQTVFGRVRGSAYSHWDPPPLSSMAMRCLPSAPGYNGCFCPGDDALLAVTGFLTTYVFGNVGPGFCCSPCFVGAGGCVCLCPGTCDNCRGGPLAPLPFCAICDSLSGGTNPDDGGTPGNVKSFPLSGPLGYNEMEALGFTVHNWDSQTALDFGWTTTTIGPFTGPDGVIFPGNSGPGTSHMIDIAGGFIWMGAYYDSTDGSALYVSVLGGCYSATLTVPGWDAQMVTNGIGGLIQVFTLGPLVPPPAPPNIAFGHAANCNAYAPIPWGSGSFSAPGNGLLVGDPTLGVIPN